ncbi:unnamed protein product [Didymodactylos carnosus]|uniref:Kinesin light chain n=1 Tax=Didymodactylos carnosus TaxID=1234261 RepID=A0A814TEV9_9BILA|nr:unnamed protein product [Didymodactylos carnosus]CAF3920684.1 unnamed protein product [Didymodactylos carnosus]
MRFKAPNRRKATAKRIEKRKRGEQFLRTDFSITSLPLPADPCSLTTATITTEPLSVSRKRQEAEFMYARFLRDILIEIESSEEEMVKFCLQKCAANQADLKIVEEFELYYDACNAIFWYTRPTFLYRLLNKALREQDIDTLYAFRYFIRDLHLQLKERHGLHQPILAEAATTACPLTSIVTTNNLVVEITETVYRGQLMDNNEFNRKIQDNVGGFFSVSSFLSTTHDRELASFYAGDGSNYVSQSVLFQIDIDTNVNKFPYANISTESAFDQEESEILKVKFFRIQSVDRCEKGVWNVQLKLTGDEDEQLNILRQHMRMNFIFRSPLGNLANLMLEMANYEKAQQYYLLLLEDATARNDHRTLAIVYNNLGFLCDQFHEQAKATEYQQKSLLINLKYLPVTDPSLAITYNNLGETYRNNGDYETALTYYEKALEIDMHSPGPDEELRAICFNNIGMVYHAQKRYSDAIEMYEKCLDIELKILPTNHPSLATTYNNISQIYRSQGNYEKTIEYLQRTLEIQRHSLPSSHILIANVYNNLSLAYYRQRDFRNALDNMKKAFDTYKTTFSLDHPQVTRMLEYIRYFAMELGKWPDEDGDDDNIKENSNNQTNKSHKS